MNIEEIKRISDIAREKYLKTYEDEENPERYQMPDKLDRATYGDANCEQIIFFGEEKTAIVDAGMAYCYERVISNIKEVLKKHNRHKIDCMLVSHSHYDHVGALPYFLKEWPEMKVYASEKCKKVFESETARRVMRELGENAKETYGKGEFDNVEIITDPLRVDVVVKEGDHIEIGKKPGDEYFEVIEAKGHTDCSLAFGYEPAHILYSSESTGVYRNKDFIHPAVLKSQFDSMETANKCKAWRAKRIISPHYGMVPQKYTDIYFDSYIKCAVAEREMVLFLRDYAKDFDELLELFTAVYWNEEREQNQPKGAFIANAVPIIKVILREYKREF